MKSLKKLRSHVSCSGVLEEIDGDPAAPTGRYFIEGSGTTYLTPELAIAALKAVNESTECNGNCMPLPSEAPPRIGYGRCR